MKNLIVKSTSRVATALFALAWASSALADDYTLEAGESATLSEAATYGTMTIAGDLTVKDAVSVQSLDISGGSVTVTGSSAHIGAATSTVADRTTVHLKQDESGAYGTVRVNGTSTASSSGLLAYQFYIDKETSEPTLTDGYLDFASVETGAFNVRQAFNNSSFTARLKVSGTAASIYRAGGRVTGPIFDTGKFRIELKDGVAFTVNVAGQGGYFNKANTAVEVVGNGSLRVIGTYNSTGYVCSFNKGAVLNHQGPIKFEKYSASNGSYFKFSDDAVIGPNVTSVSSTTDAKEGIETRFVIDSGVTLTIHGDVDLTRRGDVLEGGALKIDASERACTFKANVKTEDPTTIEKIGACDLTVSNTPNLPTLKVTEGIVRFTSDCVIGNLVLENGARVMAEDGVVLKVENGAEQLAGEFVPASGLWTEGDHVLCYFKGTAPDLDALGVPETAPGFSYVFSVVAGTGDYEGYSVLKLSAGAVTPVAATWVGGAADDALTTRVNWQGAPHLDFKNGSVQATFATSGTRAVVSGLAWFDALAFTTAEGFTLAKGDETATVGLYGSSLTATGSGTYTVEPQVRATGNVTVTAGAESKVVLGGGVSAENGSLALTAAAAGAQIELRGTNVVAGRIQGTDSNVRLTLSGLITNPDGIDTRAAVDIKGVNDDPMALALYGSETRNVYLDNVTVEKAFCATTASSNKGRTLYALANTTNRFCSAGYFYNSWGSVYAAQDSQVVFERDVRSTNGFVKYGGGELVARGLISTGGKSFNLRSGTLRVEHPNFEALNMTVSSELSSTSCTLEIATNVVNVGRILVGAQYTAYVECLVKINAGFEAGFSALGKTATSQDNKARVTGEAGSIVCLKDSDVLDIRMDGELGVKADCGMDGVVVLTNRAYAATGPLIAQKGVLELDASASWAGTNLVVRGESAETYGTLRVTTSDNFQKRRLVGAIEGTGKFDLASNVRLVFDQLTVDGEKVAPGTYTRTSTGAMAGHVTGAGSLYVRGPGLVLVFR